MPIWNPWHGCKKISPGCQHCYVYRRDAEFGKDSRITVKTANFDLPIQKNRKKEYKLQPQTEPVYTCMTSDFFIKDADKWREEIWNMIRTRNDLEFVIITKRIERFSNCIPNDWGDGYDNVTIICTCENQGCANYRLPIFLKLPIKHKQIIHEPMLESIDIEPYLASGQIEQVICGGESGEEARLCDFAWILHSMEQCVKYDVSFWFKQTGALFKKGEKIYCIDRKYQMEQAQKANVNYQKGELAEILDTDISPTGNLFERLAKSKFRSSFSLKQSDFDYIEKKGLIAIQQHAEDFIRVRLAPAVIANDGKQTPMRGHPVFIAQHATATCCRNCLKKWHNIESGVELTQAQQEYVVDVIMEWIQRQEKK